MFYPKILIASSSFVCTALKGKFNHDIVELNATCAFISSALAGTLNCYGLTLVMLCQ
jgi:NifU-like protein involved in Fe-S cluster formation